MNCVWVIALVVTTLFCARGQAAGNTAQHGSDIEQAVRQLDHEWSEAVVRRDAEALAQLLADDYTMIDPSGEVIDKAQEIAQTKAPLFDVTIESLRTEDVEVRISGERATIIGRAVLQVRFDEQEISEQYCYTRTFARRQGRWQIIAAQLTYHSTGK